MIKNSPQCIMDSALKLLSVGVGLRKYLKSIRGSTLYKYAYGFEKDH